MSTEVLRAGGRWMARIGTVSETPDAADTEAGSWLRQGAWGGSRPRGILGAMVDQHARDRAIYQALKAVDEVAAALQTHLIEEHQADPERAATQSTSTNSLKLLRQARERLGEGLRTIEADDISQSDEISLRNE
jgi:hypothetical protein